MSHCSTEPATPTGTRSNPSPTTQCSRCARLRSPNRSAAPSTSADWPSSRSSTSPMTPTGPAGATFLAFVGLDGDPPSDGLTFSSYQVCLDVAERGDGVALGWERTVRPRIEAGNLVALTDLTMPQRGVINAYLPPARDPAPPHPRLPVPGRRRYRAAGPQRHQRHHRLTRTISRSHHRRAATAPAWPPGRRDRPTHRPERGPPRQRNSSSPRRRQR